MDTTLPLSTQPTALQNIRSKITRIEALELGLLGLGIWAPIVGLASSSGDASYDMWAILLVLIEGGILGSWLIYNLYIRLARAGGPRVDIKLWILAASLTASYTFWAWTILDINRFLVAKLLYRGEAPVEYAWSLRSKVNRQAWEEARKASTI